MAELPCRTVVGTVRTGAPSFSHRSRLHRVTLRSHGRGGYGPAGGRKICQMRQRIVGAFEDGVSDEYGFDAGPHPVP